MMFSVRPLPSLTPPSFLLSNMEDIGGDTGIAEDNRVILERVRMNTRQEYLAEGKATGSVRATDRLMRELQDIYRSKNYKSGEKVEVCGRERETLGTQRIFVWCVSQ